MQWLPYHNLREADYQKIIRTFASVFPNATLWYTGGSHTLLLATPAPLTKASLARSLASIDNESVIQSDLGLRDRKYLVMENETLRGLPTSGRGAVATDDNAFFLPYNEETERVRQVLEAAQKQHSTQ